jgi:hypothetical protein
MEVIAQVESTLSLDEIALQVKIAQVLRGAF